HLPLVRARRGRSGMPPGQRLGPRCEHPDASGSKPAPPISHSGGRSDATVLARRRRSWRNASLSIRPPECFSDAREAVWRPPPRGRVREPKGGRMSEMEAELTDTETGRCFGCGQLFSTEEELSTH